jgi:hypothetical protein
MTLLLLRSHPSLALFYKIALLNAGVLPLSMD